MIYCVCNASQVERLCREALAAGFDGTWVPMEEQKVVRQPKGGKPYVETVVVPAYYGYIFVPWKHHRAFWRWVPECYGFNYCYTHGGRFDRDKRPTKLQHMDSKRHAVVDISVLREHDAACRGIDSPVEKAALRQLKDYMAGKPVYEIGDEVEARVGQTYVSATVIKFRGENRVHLSTSVGYMTVSQEKIRKK